MKEETFKKASEITDTIKRLKNQRELLADISNNQLIFMKVGLTYTDIVYDDFNKAFINRVISEELSTIDEKLVALQQEFDNL